jgi:hypothetical protein
MSGTGKRAPDALNMFAVVVVGAVGALLTYVSIVALQAYYASSAGAEMERKQRMGMGAEYRSLQASHEAELREYRQNQGRNTFRLPLDRAMELVVEDTRAGRAAQLVAAVGPSDTPTVPAVPGKPLPEAAVPAPDAPPEEGAADDAPADDGDAPADPAEGEPADSDSDEAGGDDAP